MAKSTHIKMSDMATCSCNGSAEQDKESRIAGAKGMEAPSSRE